MNSFNSISGARRGWNSAGSTSPESLTHTSGLGALSAGGLWRRSSTDLQTLLESSDLGSLRRLRTAAYMEGRWARRRRRANLRGAGEESEVGPISGILRPLEVRGKPGVCDERHRWEVCEGTVRW